jgi:hypothetical protein
VLLWVIDHHGQKNQGDGREGLFPAGGERRAPGTETVPEPNGNEAIVYENFFIANMRMPPHPTLADILLNFRHNCIS